MRVIHTGLVSSSEKNADLFYRDVLGLVKSASLVLPVQIMSGIFGISREIQVVNYKSDGVHFEIFIDPSYKKPDYSMAHPCLEMDDLNGFLTKCGSKGIHVSRTPKGDSFVIFISDPDGNLFEVKERKSIV